MTTINTAEQAHDINTKGTGYSILSQQTRA